jgi:hypothetical protein
MKAILQHILLVGALGICGASCWGQLPPRTDGKVLVLDSGRTLEGDIERHDNQFRIRRSGGEVWVPVEPGMRLCADWKDAFAYMSGQANRLDPDERVRLARWCLSHGLRDQALAEAMAAVQMQPDHPEARQLRDTLQRTLLMDKTDAQAGPFALTAAPAKLPAVDISSDSVAMFATRVQPILMNTCVSCHSGSKAGAFQLYRTYNGGQRVATLKNLAAVLPLINPQNPELSPLLIKAVSPHGANAQSPLKRESVPFYTLQTWVLQTLTNNKQLLTRRPSAARSPSPMAQVAHSAIDRTQTAVQPKSTGGHAATIEEMPMKDNPRATTDSPGIPPATTQPPTSFADQAPSSPAEPMDPFDPVIFNRQTRPQR